MTIYKEYKIDNYRQAIDKIKEGILFSEITMPKDEFYKLYDYAEDSKRVLTIKVKDRKNSKILHSCDFAVANDYTDNQGNYHQKFIYFNKKQNTYEWQEQPEGFYMLDEKIGWIKENDLWQEVRDSYIERKNSNNNPNKKSRSIFAETVAAVFNDNGGF